MKGTTFNILPFEQKVEVVLSGGEWYGYRNENNITYNLYYYHGFFVELAMEEHKNTFVSVEPVSKNIVLFLSTGERSTHYYLL